MTYRLRIHSLAVVLFAAAAIAQAQSAPPAAAESPENYLQTSARRLAEIPSLDVRLRQQVQLYGQQVIGNGRYLQKRTDRGPLLLRLELDFEFGGVTSTLTQLCDGRFLWIQRDVMGNRSLGRVDLQRIQEALRQSRRNPLSDASTNWLLLGGLPRLMQSLDEHFDFAPPRPAKMDASQVWILDGQWKPDRLVEMLPDQAEAIRDGGVVDLTGLPLQVPTSVEVVLGREDLLPYRIDYRRVEQPLAGQATAAAGKSMMLMELIEIRRRDDLQDSAFRFEPPQQAPEDLTDLYLSELGLAPVPEQPAAN